MTTYATPPRAADDAQTLLRRILLLDAAASLLIGAVPAVLAGSVADRLGLPAGLPRPLGLFLLAWAVFVAGVATRRPPPTAGVLVVVGLNLVWAVAGIEAAVARRWDLTAVGAEVVPAQALATLAVTAVEIWALRRLRAARTGVPTLAT